MGHSGHDHGTEGKSDRNLVVAVLVNVVLTAAQIIGGMLSGSLALIADALHNFNDAISLGLAIVARRIARKPADARRTFGYKRAEVIGALINLTALIVVALYLLYEAIVRFFDQQPIEGWMVIWIAGLALVIDLVTAWLTYRMAKESLNIKAAFFHNVADALASVGVILAGALILLFEWYEVDLIVTVAISAYILLQSFKMMKSSIRVLMESVPQDVKLDEVIQVMAEVQGVQNMHHVHIWELDEHHRALEAHVVVEESSFTALEETKRALKEVLRKKFEISHSTLEFEAPAKAAENEARTEQSIQRPGSYCSPDTCNP